MIIYHFLMALCNHQQNYGSLWYPLSIEQYATLIWFDYLKNLRVSQYINLSLHKT